MALYHRVLYLADSFFRQFLPTDQHVYTLRIQRISGVLLVLFLIWLLARTVVLFLAGREADQPSLLYREPPHGASGLVVIVHGWMAGPPDMNEVAEVVAGLSGYNNFGIWLWGYSAGRFSNKEPAGLAHDLCMGIEEQHRRCSGEVVLIGHSLGGLLLRRAWLEGLDDERSWAGLVSRIVLLAAPNRGTTATDRSWALWLGDALVRSFRVARLIQGVYRGAPFVVDLRIDWIRRFSAMKNPPLVAQIIGGNDGKVSVSDSNDMLQFPSAIQRTLMNSTHESIVLRREVGPDLGEILTMQAQRHDASQEAGDGRVVKVFLAHGIRDYGERFRDIADVVRAAGAPLHLTVVATAPRYRYFSALQFINPLSRRAKMYDFADRYTELLASRPVSAPIHFVGHSFGTYLMLKGTDEYRAMHFDRAYLAGSVLHEDFLSKRQLLGQRIGHVRNDIASRDWAVGLLCSALDGLGLAIDVGTAGFNGFTAMTEPQLYDEIRYYDGGHGRALDPPNRANIAAWLFQDWGPAKFNHLLVEKELAAVKAFVSKRPTRWDLYSHAAPFVAGILLTFFVYLILFGIHPGLVVCILLVITVLLQII